MQDKTKKIIVFAVIAVLAVGVIAAVIWGSNAQAQANTYESHLGGLYEKSISELADDVYSLQTLLAKAVVSASPKQFTLILSESWRTSGEAIGVLSQIPGRYSQLGELNRFLIQTGDFCHTLLRKVASDIPITQEDRDQLTSLHNSSATLLEKIEDYQANGSTAFSYTNGMEYYDYEEASSQADAAAPSGGEASQSDSAGGYEGGYKEDAGDEKYPTLIYDGPFSDSTAKAEPKGLGAGQADDATAMACAQQFLGDLLGGELALVELQGGRIPSYRFTGVSSDGRALEILITQQGGHCLNFMFDPDASLSGLLPTPQRGSELGEIGREFLKSRGLSSMEPTYAQYYSGVATINYAYVQDGVMIYNDLIKVWVEIGSGKVIGYDANNYLFSHVPRTIPAAEITPEEARARVSSALSIESVKQALIPISIAEEVYCYEFKGTFGGDSFIVYINALTGEEEQILRIIDSEQGQLTL